MTYVIIVLMTYSSPNYPPQKTHFYCFTNRVLFCTPNCIGIIVFQLFEQTYRVGQLKWGQLIFFAGSIWMRRQNSMIFWQM